MVFRAGFLEVVLLRLRKPCRPLSNGKRFVAIEPPMVTLDPLCYRTVIFLAQYYHRGIY